MKENAEVMQKQPRWRWRAVLAVLFGVGGTALVVMAAHLGPFGLRTTPGGWRVVAGLAVLLAALAVSGLPVRAPGRGPGVWQNLRRVLLLTASITTLVVAFYTVENWRGRRAWDAYLQELAARGDTIDLPSLAPPPVPDDQNFCQCALLRPILDLKKTNGVAVWADTNGYARIQALRSTLGARDGWPTTTNGLAAWQAYYRSLTATDSLPAASRAIVARYGLTGPGSERPILAGLELTNSPAQDVLLVLRRFDPELDELKREAVRRPLDRWAIGYLKSPFDVLLPHLANVKGLCSLLQLREMAELEVGEREGAWSDLNLGIRLTESVRREPIIISQLVRAACWDLVLAPFRQPIRAHQLTEAQLVSLQQRLIAVDLLEGYECSMGGERVFDSTWLALTRAECDSMRGEYNPELIQSLFDILRFTTYAPRGWVYQNQVVLCRLTDNYLAACVDPPRRLVSPAKSVALREAFTTAHGPYSALVPSVFQLQVQFGNLYFRGAQFAHSQTKIDQAVIACALERHWLAHSEYPETLEALVPQFLAKVPHDLINGAPLHYHRTPEGSYTLYSVGWNETDDGGQTAPPKDGRPDLERGDWVW